MSTSDFFFSIIIIFLPIYSAYKGSIYLTPRISKNNPIVYSWIYFVGIFFYLFIFVGLTALLFVLYNNYFYSYLATISPPQTSGDVPGGILSGLLVVGIFLCGGAVWLMRAVHKLQEGVKNSRKSSLKIIPTVYQFALAVVVVVLLSYIGYSLFLSQVL